MKLVLCGMAIQALIAGFLSLAGLLKLSSEQQIFAGLFYMIILGIIILVEVLTTPH